MQDQAYSSVILPGNLARSYKNWNGHKFSRTKHMQGFPVSFVRNLFVFHLRMFNNNRHMFSTIVLGNYPVTSSNGMYLKVNCNENLIFTCNVPY